MTKCTSTAPRKRSPASLAESKRRITPEERYEMIAKAAYYRAERYGFSSGDAAADWLAAEAEIDAMLAQDNIAAAADLVSSAMAGDPAAIAERVREITLAALSGRQLDKDAIRQIAEAVIATGKQEVAGGKAKAAEAAHALKEAVRGLDEALAVSAEAMHLALQEAAGRGDEFSRTTLRQAGDDLAALESLFIETLSAGAEDAKGIAQATLKELAAHARVGGTAIRERITPALVQMGQLVADSVRSQVEDGSETLRRESALLAGLAAGMLAGLADRAKRRGQE
ncbi:MAG: DUF2934 domain-containing protein [Gallionellaceae bacterium]|nr:DUF2934 domain-containing protein [Gallionellaceae bacterium]